jgi:hypothetical protein
MATPFAYPSVHQIGPSNDQKHRKSHVYFGHGTGTNGGNSTVLSSLRGAAFPISTRRPASAIHTKSGAPLRTTCPKRSRYVHPVQVARCCWSWDRTASHLCQCLGNCSFPRPMQTASERTDESHVISVLTSAISGSLPTIGRFHKNRRTGHAHPNSSAPLSTAFQRECWTGSDRRILIRMTSPQQTKLC